MLLAVLAGLLVAWRAYLEPYRRQQQTIELVKKLGGRVVTAESPDWLRRLSGDDCQNVVLVDLADRDAPAEYLDTVVSLPALETLVVGGAAFGDQELQRLRHIRTLSGLVLDCTEVTPTGLAELRSALPRLEIYQSQRRAIVAISGHRAVVFKDGDFPPCRTASGELESRVDYQYFDELKSCYVDGGNEEMVHVKHLHSLEGLYLDGGQITDAGLTHLSSFANLKRLTITSWRITDSGLVHLAGLRNLEVLRVRGEITDNALVNLKGLARLQHLDLSHTLITDAAIAHLRVLQALEHLDVEGTRITEQGAAELQKALPRCKVRAFPKYLPRPP